MGKKYVAILISLGYGGGRKYVMELARAIKNKYGDIDITLFSPCKNKDIELKKSADEEIKKLKIKLIYFNVFEIPILMDRVPSTISGIKSLFNLDKFDVVYITDPSLIINLIILLSLKFKKAKTKIVFGVHDPGFLRKAPQKATLFRRIALKIYRPIYKSIMFKIPNFHVLNENDKKMLKREGYSGKIYLIPNFLYYNRDQIKIKGNRKKFIVLFGARLAIYHKGIDLLNDIIEKVLSKNGKVKFHIFGPGGDGSGIVEKLANKYSKNVRYLGYISEKRLEDEYKQASVYIVTSRIEAFPLVTLEAQAHGLPVVAFDIKGPHDIIKKKFQGRLIEPFNVNKFADTTLMYYNLWKKGKLNKEYKNKIKEYIFSKYSDKKIIPKIKKMLIEK